MSIWLQIVKEQSLTTCVQRVEIGPRSTLDRYAAIDKYVQRMDTVK